MGTKKYNIVSAGILSVMISTFFVSVLVFAQTPAKYFNDKDERDPFISLVTSDGRLLKFERERSGPIEVEGIIYDAQGLSYVIVNEDILGIGDRVGEYQLYKIEKNKVIFLKEGKELEVIVKEEE